jgi:hypothetical protein
MIRTRTSALNQPRWILALVFSLLFAQFSGLQHRIEHANRHDDQRVSRVDSAKAADDAKKESRHSCSLFDAATLADTLDATPPCPLPAISAYIPAPWIMRASWHAPVFLPFRSRAPPAVLVLN